jgi:hypothetical protein
MASYDVARNICRTILQGDLTGGTLLNAAAETPLNQALLSIKPGVLTAGQQYVFRASATGDADGLTADVAVDANAPPRGGGITAAPLVPSDTTAAATLAALGRAVQIDPTKPTWNAPLS